MATKKWQKSYFDVLGLCCSSEVPLIEKILKPLDGVKEISVIVPSRTLIVVHDNLLISQIQIVKALNQARLEANVRIYGEVAYQKKWPSPFAIVSGILLLLSFLKYVYQPFRWLALGAVAAGIFPIAWRGIVAIRNFTLDINILVLIAVIGTIALNDYWEAGSIVFLFTIAEWLESRASHKATAVMSSLMSIAPQKAVIADTGEIVEANSVLVDTIIAVKTGEVIPEDKARIIKDFKEEGPTAMIGDGVNDAPALATADIGISMGIAGSALATETGHVVLMTNDIRKIPKAVRLARKTHRKVVENIILSITTKAAILALAIAGHPLIWAAVLADVGTCLLVIFNSMLLLRGTHQHGGKCCKSSAASHVDKHGCKGGGSHSSHNHQHSCSNSISQKKCEPQKCSSQRCASRCQPDHSGLSSCVNTKCTDSADRHDCCVGNEGHHDMQHCDQRSGNTATHGTELHNKPNHSCSGHSFPSLCVKDEGANLVDRLCDGGGDGFHESKHCKHGG